MLKLPNNVGGGVGGLNTKPTFWKQNFRPPFARRIARNTAAYRGSLLQAFQFSFDAPAKPTCGPTASLH
jgi:hypothetical protein